MNSKRVAVGEQVPDFTLLDTEDKPVRLSDFTGKRIVYLVFNRGFT